MKPKRFFIAIATAGLLSGILLFNKSSLMKPVRFTYNGFSQDVSQLEEIPFTRLTIKEVEKQKTGSTGESGAIPKQDIIFSDAKAWQDFWRKYSRDDVENVDFTKYTVAGVFVGEKPSSGYRVEIKKILYDPQKKVIQIKVEEQTPSRSTGQLTVLTYPADLVMFETLPGTIEFIHSGQALKD